MNPKKTSTELYHHKILYSVGTDTVIDQEITYGHGRSVIPSLGLLVACVQTEPVSMNVKKECEYTVFTCHYYNLALYCILS